MSLRLRSNAKWLMSIGVGAIFIGIAFINWRKNKNIRTVNKKESKDNSNSNSNSNSNNNSNSSSNSNTNSSGDNEKSSKKHIRRRSSLVSKDVIRVNTPYGFGVIDDHQLFLYGSDPIVTVHLPNKTIAHLNRNDITELSDDEPILVRTPFGLGELIGAKLNGADFEPDEENGNAFKVKFPWSIAYLNAESVRIANAEPYPQVLCEPFGQGQIIDPPQSSFKITPNAQNKIVVKFEWGATGYMNPDCVALLDRGFTLEK